MTAEPPLWRDGWDVEPDTADPPPDRRGHGNPYGNVPDDEPGAYRDIHTVTIKGELL
ncbi:hypothetical protein ACFV9E_06380 [Streptomyces sp. NPDC059835]|uniref:hypothetical protein n=1 Tax=Streptomyces sp. NPDC059835 TaxID=3346967 RepID=UPI003664EADC